MYSSKTIGSRKENIQNTDYEGEKLARRGTIQASTKKDSKSFYFALAAYKAQWQMQKFCYLSFFFFQFGLKLFKALRMLESMYIT